MQIGVLIPTYRPEKQLEPLVSSLLQLELRPIVVVDDGSGPEWSEQFNRLQEMSEVEVVSRSVNRGKGAAIRIGLEYVQSRYPQWEGVVTADSDGQHLPEDVHRVVLQLKETPQSLVLGCRKFETKIPFRSRIGNVLTRWVCQLMLKQSLSDTQTGLRGIPAGCFETLLRLRSDRFEFEMEMLLVLSTQGVTFVEVPIATVYESGNRQSHFRPLADSIRIYKVLFGFYRRRFFGK